MTCNVNWLSNLSALYLNASAYYSVFLRGGWFHKWPGICTHYSQVTVGIEYNCRFSFFAAWCFLEMHQPHEQNGRNLYRMQTRDFQDFLYLKFYTCKMKVEHEVIDKGILQRIWGKTWSIGRVASLPQRITKNACRHWYGWPSDLQTATIWFVFEGPQERHWCLWNRLKIAFCNYGKLYC